MNTYPFDSLWINGRELSIADIIANTTKPVTDFEASTFLVVREWMSGVSSFSLQTSGSTGPPKEIRLSREHMMASARMTAEALRLKPGMIALVCLDTRYIAGKMMVVRCLVTGMKIVAVDPCANPFQKISSSLHLDFVALVPLQVSTILESAKADRFNSLHTVIIGGSALPPALEKTLRACSCRSYVTYGMTETISHIALHRIGMNEPDQFEVLPGVRIAQDERGCLIIEANHFPEKVITNDIVQLIDARTFRWLGRYDNVINSGGVKIHSEKVEAQIEKIFTRLNIKTRFFITGLGDQKLGEKVVMIIEGEPDLPLAKMIKNELKLILSRFEYPKNFYFIPEFVVTETGKIDRPSTLRIMRDSKIF